MNMTQALAKFENMVVNLLGGYTTFDTSSGFWHINIAPGGTVPGSDASNTRIIVNEGTIEVTIRMATVTVKTGEYIDVKMGYKYKISSEAGASILLKHF